MHSASIITGACPKCGQAPLFHHLVVMHTECSHCHTDFAGRDIGDGAIFIAILLVSTIVTILSVIVEFKYEPAFWIHAALWIPVIMILSLLALRMGRAFTLYIILKQEQSS